MRVDGREIYDKPPVFVHAHARTALHMDSCNK
jgi:hypothetical protein